jgi:Ca2+-binding RTX toxin-like protein
VVRRVITINPGVAGNDIMTGGDGNNTLIGGSGSDTITLGIGYSIVIGDGGEALFNSSAIFTTVRTVDPGFGAADTITGASGSNVIMGGAGADSIIVNDLGDVILGDNGSATFNDAGVLLTVTSTDPTSGDNDTITTGVGANVVLGGPGADLITGGTGDDVIFGDQGKLTFNAVAGKSVLATAESLDAAAGGNDTLTGALGRNILFGGAGSDTLSGGDQGNVLVGDNAKATFTNGLLVTIESIDHSVGAADTFTALDGPTTVIGGAGADTSLQGVVMMW